MRLFTKQPEKARFLSLGGVTQRRSGVYGSDRSFCPPPPVAWVIRKAFFLQSTYEKELPSWPHPTPVARSGAPRRLPEVGGGRCRELRRRCGCGDSSSGGRTWPQDVMTLINYPRQRVNKITAKTKKRVKIWISPPKWFVNPFFLHPVLKPFCKGGDKGQGKRVKEKTG